MTISNFFLVFVGGGLGAAVRFLVTTAAARWAAFPLGTLAVNAVGSFLMGLIMGAVLLLTEKYELIAEPLRLLLAVGFLGVGGGGKQQGRQGQRQGQKGRGAGQRTGGDHAGLDRNPERVGGGAQADQRPAACAARVGLQRAGFLLPRLPG